MKTKEKIIQALEEKKDKITHYLAPDGDSTQINSYLKSIKVKSKKGCVFLTIEQHKMLHKLEAQRFQ